MCGIAELEKPFPLELAERGLFLQGLPSICKPDVRKDVVQDDLISWPKDRLLALEESIDKGLLAVLKRDPLCAFHVGLCARPWI